MGLFPSPPVAAPPDSSGAPCCQRLSSLLSHVPCSILSVMVPQGPSLHFFSLLFLGSRAHCSHLPRPWGCQQVVSPPHSLLSFLSEPGLSWRSHVDPGGPVQAALLPTGHGEDAFLRCSPPPPPPMVLSLSPNPHQTALGLLLLVLPGTWSFGDRRVPCCWRLLPGDKSLPPLCGSLGGRTPQSAQSVPINVTKEVGGQASLSRAGFAGNHRDHHLYVTSRTPPPPTALKIPPPHWTDAHANFTSKVNSRKPSAWSHPPLPSRCLGTGVLKPTGPQCPHL